jgi:hypothetical protein
MWERVFWKWVRRGADRSYAAWMADLAEKRLRRMAFKVGRAQALVNHNAAKVDGGSNG